LYPIVNTIEATDTRAVSDGLKAMGGAEVGVATPPLAAWRWGRGFPHPWGRRRLVAAAASRRGL